LGDSPLSLEAPDGATPSLRGAPRGRFGGVLLLALVGLQLAATAVVGTSSDEERRVRIALRLFRSLLAADTGLEAKTRKDGSVLVAFVYGADRSRAEEAATSLRARIDEGSDETVRGLPLAVETASSSSVERWEERPPAAIFIAEPLEPRTLRSVVRFGIDHRVIVYSPFEGDVERGVLAGISIEAQVRPYVNQATLEASHVELKPFFLKVTKVYR
jgi:hypothetical protein